MGYEVAGFSVNTDAGASLKRTAIEERLKHVKDGNVIIARMNRPTSDSAEGLSIALDGVQRAGCTFVRLDQVKLEVVPEALRNKNQHQRSIDDQD